MNSWAELEGRQNRGAGETKDSAERAPIGHRLAVSKRLIVLGDPGGGKTTLTRWIATAYLLKLKNDPDQNQIPDVSTLPNESWLPVLIRCRDLDRDWCIDTLDTMITQSLRKAELSNDEIPSILTYLRNEIEGGRALLIIDGLDEVADATKRVQLCEQLERVADAYPDLPIIATSRIVGYREMGRRLGRNFEHLTLCDLSLDEKEGFAKRWCALTLPSGAEEAANELIADIRSNDRVQRLTGNPMLLTTMALVKRSIGRLPQRRAELYIEAVKALLNWRNDKGERLEAEEALPQLQYIAYAMCERGVQTLKRDELLDLVAEMRVAYPNIHDATRHNAAQFIELLESRTGILMQSGYVRHLGEEVPVFEFRHLTFQEFLAAQALVKKVHPGYRIGRTLADRITPLAERVGNLWAEQIEQEGESWQEVLRLCLTLCDAADVDLALRAILDASSDATRRPRAMLAAQCLTDEPNAGDAVANEVLTALAGSISHSDQYHGQIVSRISFSLSLSRWRDGWVDCLMEQYLSKNADNRLAVGSLISDLYDEVAPAGSKFGARWLSRIKQSLRGGLPERVKAALELMMAAFRERIRRPGDIGDELTKILNQDNATDLAAIWALWWLSENTTVKVHDEAILKFISRHDIEDDAKRFAIFFFKNRPALGALRFLLKEIKHDDKAIRGAAVEALGAFVALPEARASLLVMLRHEDRFVRASALDVFLGQKEGIDRRLFEICTGKIGSVDTLDPLEQILPDQVLGMSKILGRPVSEIIDRYRVLADELGLMIAPEVFDLVKRQPSRARRSNSGKAGEVN